VLLASGTSAFLAALVQGRQGWGSPDVVLLLALAALLLVGFVAVQRRSASAMLDLALLRHPPFAAATGAAFATGAGSIALLSFLPGFLGIALGISASGAAWLLLVWSGTSVAAALLARRIPPRVPGRVQLAIGLAGVGAGQLALTAVDTGSTWRHFLPGLLVAGVASGVLNAALGREAVSSVPADRAGLGSGANNTARYIGSAVGVTLVAVIVARPGPGNPVEDVVHGWNIAAVVTGLVSLVGALAVLACRERRTPQPADETQPAVVGLPD
jgi:predicted MFS family arabinose efflux permease